MATITKVHNKLVRDRIPEYLKENGVEPEIEVIEDEVRYLRLLIDKLDEETQEAGVALEDADLLEELADIESVVDGILKAKGWTRKDLKDVQDEKDERRGKFDEKIFLISTFEEEENENSESGEES
jgi:predicted house-cleaning noncanonical NTP pyrophosphatase (MazG superfamily)